MQYALPPYLRSSSLLGPALGGGLPDDFVFSQGMKLVMLVSAIAAYTTRLGFCFGPEAATKAKPS